MAIRVLIFSNPIKNIAGSDKIIFKEDTTLIPNKQFDLIIAQSERSIVQMIFKNESTNNIFKENTKYSLFIPPGTFTDIFDLTNDTIQIDLKTREAKYYGSLKLKLNIPETKNNYIVQLIDEQGIIQRVHQLKKSEDVFYEYLHPKKYKLKIIVDENSNDKWDSGNYLQHTQAEKVIYNSELINVRSNWDLELDWKVQ